MMGSTLTEAWDRARMVAQAWNEYLRLVADAWRFWLYGALGIGIVLGLIGLTGVSIPLWSLAVIPLLILFAVQFWAFYCVREERETFNRTLQSHLDAIAALRGKESEIKNRVVRDEAGYARWKADLMALRAEIHRKIAAGISRAEAETFHTIGNLRHNVTVGINEEHNLMLAVAMRDLDHLAELIHGYARFARD